MFEALFFAVAYAFVGMALLAAGYWAFDLLTPGKLGEQIFTGKSVNAAIVLSSMLIGVGAVVFTALWTNSETGFGSALEWTVAFGVLGIVLQVVSFLLLDLVTPGKLREIVVSTGFHPASMVAAAAVLATSAVVVASIA